MTAAVLLATVLTAPPLTAAPQAPAAASPAAPLSVGDTFTILSKVLGEVRRINVYVPPGYDDAPRAAVPVLYMPDGGMQEDFLHVAGLVQVSVGNRTMRPFLLVGIENTERRRDLTGPTTVEEDRKIAPRVGGSAAFRTFIRTELMPAIKARYRVTRETAIVGESLAGLFVVETCFLEPDLFDTYIAIDPSLFWNAEALVTGAAERLKAFTPQSKTLPFASSDYPGLYEPTARLATILEKHPRPGLVWRYQPMPGEQHSTIYHPAAVLALRALFKPHLRSDRPLPPQGSNPGQTRVRPTSDLAPTPRCPQPTHRFALTRAVLMDSARLAVPLRSETGLSQV